MTPVIQVGFSRKVPQLHSSCEIEDFVETHLCKLCVDTPIAPILRVVCPLIKDIGRRLPLKLYICVLYIYTGRGADCHTFVTLLSAKRGVGTST